MARSYSPELRAADDARLAGTHPHLHVAALRILDTLAAFGTPAHITQAVRTDEAQRLLYAQGRTAPGKIVTNADGLVAKSMHQRQLDGYGHAIDIAFLDDPYGETQPWALYGQLGEHLNLTWGGRWRSFPDRPHLELSLSAKL